jgi:replicative DNA helicase
MSQLIIPKVLTFKTISQAVEDAKSLIDAERSGEVTGLYTRWRGVNRSLMKYWRFNLITMIAGASGSGKSAILNMLEDDFTNPDLNPYFLAHIDRNKGSSTYGQIVGEDKIMVLAFKYEMDAVDEVLRNISGKVKKSYSYLLSGEVQLNSKGEKVSALEQETYNKINDEEFLTISKELDKLKSKRILFFENAGNLDQLYTTVASYKEKYPHIRIIVTVDHTLLSLKLSEKDDLELISRTAHTAIKLKKTLGCNVILLNQLNGEIEKPIRRDNPILHFPVKSDIHCAAQIYWACDNVMIFHRPENLGIIKYGNKFPVNTDKLVHCAWIKSRKNKSGNIYFKEEFSQGNMSQVDPSEIAFKSISM